MDQLITIDVSGLERFRHRDLKQLRGAFAGARRALLNNMAFDVRKIALEWAIPRVMTVRAPGILRVTLRVSKAAKGSEVATLGQTGKGRTFTSLREEEFGEDMHQQPATLAGRAGNKIKRIPSRFQLGKDFVTSADIKLAHEKSEEQRIHVFLEKLQRPRGLSPEPYQGPFILPRFGKSPPGLWRLGRRRKPVKPVRSRDSIKYSRVLIPLRRFTKQKTRVKKTKWMWPSIKRYLATHTLRIEWVKAINNARRYHR